MKSCTKLATLFATTSLLAAAAAPAFAASARTDAFVANVAPNVDFLNDSSRLALETSASPRIKSFARSEAIEQTITGNSLVAWQQTNTQAGEVAAIGTPLAGPLAPVGDLVVAPLDLAANVTGTVTNGVGDVLTGRSVSIDNPLAPLAPVAVPAPAPVLPAGQEDLSRLQALQGRRFDALYRSTQTDALRQLATLYADYMQNGDDPGLRAMATRQLPIVNHRLAELRAL